MADLISDNVFVQTLTAIKSKVDLFLNELSTQGGRDSLSSVNEEKGTEVLKRLEDTLDDLSDLCKTSKVSVDML